MTGRNDPCTCGSGKKYKKCCLQLHQTIIRPDQLTDAEHDELFGGEGYEWPDEGALQALATKNGWNISKLRLLRSRGARYSATRRSFVFWSPWSYQEHPVLGEPSERFDAYLSTIGFEGAGVLGEIKADSTDVLAYLDPCSGVPRRPPGTVIRKVRCREEGCSFSVRSEVARPDEPEVSITHLTSRITCHECGWSGNHSYSHAAPDGANIVGCPQCGEGEHDGHGPDSDYHDPVHSHVDSR